MSAKKKGTMMGKVAKLFKAAPKRSAPKKAVRKATKSSKLKAKPAKKIARKTAPKRSAPKKAVRKATKPIKASARTSRAKERTKARAALAQRLAHAPISAPTIEERKPIPKYPILPGADSDRVRMLIPLLKDAVRKRLISDWRINLASTRSANLYLGQDLALEDDQRATREDVLVTVYRRLEDGQQGEAQIPILSDSTETAREDIAQASELAAVTRKPAFDLPEPVEGLHFPHGHDQHVFDAFDAGDGGRVARQVLDDLRTQMSAVRDVRLAAAEILTSAAVIRVVNSRGVDVSFRRTALLLELTLVSKGKTDEQEFHWTADAVSPDQFDLRTTIPREAQRARDALAAIGSPGFSGGILLTSEALRDYMTPLSTPNPVVLHAHARLKAMGISRLVLGERIGDIKGEPVTISSNPHVPLGALSIPVDEEGTPLRPFDIVRLGTFQQWVAGPRYAHELDVPLTGNVANVQLSAGATREDYLRGNSYVEIVAFSWFNPDGVSGDYSAEIRLGYLWENGKATPFRGGHMVGNAFTDLGDVRLSREIMQSGRYYGPRAVLLKSGNVTRSA